MKFTFKKLIIISFFILTMTVTSVLTLNAADTYTVKSGDTLTIISKTYGLTIDQLMSYNNLSSYTIYVGQQLKLSPEVIYTVKSGDSLWSIALKFNTTVDSIKTLNKLSSNTIYINQVLHIPTASSSTTTPSTTAPTTSAYIKYIVKSGDSLSLIASKYNTTVELIKTLNKLSSNTIYINQVLQIPNTTTAPSTTSPTPVTNWPSITYIVKSGDSASSIAAKFGVSSADIIKYNYMRATDWLDAGDKIAINGYAPRNYAVTPGESSAPSSVGKLVDWFLDGQYLIKRNDTFLITDVKTGLKFNVKMMGGYNHADIEPLTATDTATMKKLFPTWDWAPRPVVVFNNGINFAASLSGMPHSFDSVSGNNVTGHFDLYLYNSKSHSSDTSTIYMQQHQANVLIAAGK
ncbi:MAG: LysM domain protein [Clostridia bacterium]|nr:LysM domain protein [Clostridia bacterium]